MLTGTGDSSPLCRDKVAAQPASSTKFNLFKGFMIQAYNYIIHIGPFLQVKFCLSNFHLFVCFISICWLLAVCIVWIIYIIIISQWSWMCMGNPGIFFLSHHICISIFIERNTSSVQLIVRQILVNLVYVCHSMTGRGENDIINKFDHIILCT